MPLSPHKQAIVERLLVPFDYSLPCLAACKQWRQSTGRSNNEEAVSIASLAVCELVEKLTEPIEISDDLIKCACRKAKDAVIEHLRKSRKIRKRPGDPLEVAVTDLDEAESTAVANAKDNSRLDLAAALASLPADLKPLAEARYMQREPLWFLRVHFANVDENLKAVERHLAEFAHRSDLQNALPLEDGAES